MKDFDNISTLLSRFSLGFFSYFYSLVCNCTVSAVPKAVVLCATCRGFGPRKNKYLYGPQIVFSGLVVSSFGMFVNCTHDLGEILVLSKNDFK